MVSLITFIAPWIVISFLDLIFKTCMFVPYLKALHTAGMNLNPLVFTWTASLPRLLNNIGRKWPTFVRVWFSFGSLFAVLFLLPCTILFLVSIFSANFGNDNQTDDTYLMVPVVPGYNIPIYDLGYFFTVLLVSSVFHELGHIIAARRENVAVESVGFGVLFIFPFAFTNINPEQMKDLPDRAKLRIYAAGVWHNVILCVVAALLLLSSPFLLASFYHYGQGITVAQVNHNYINAEVAGLKVGDEVVSINECIVKDATSWRNCLSSVIYNEQHGFCVPKDFIMLKNIAIKDSKLHDCCGFNESHHMCFTSWNESGKLLCLPARKTVTDSPVCSSNSSCSKEAICLTPVFENISDKFIEIHRVRTSSVMYIGSIKELLEYVSVTSVRAKSTIFSTTYIVVAEKFLIYILYLSSGYACLNLLPCYFLDGALISEIIFLKMISYFLALSNYSVSQRKLLECINLFQKYFSILMCAALVYFLVKIFLY